MQGEGAVVWAHSREHAVVRHLEDAQVVHVTGDDARTWLNGQTTNDVRQVGDDAAVYALSLDAKGRIQADLWVVAEGEALAFVAPAASLERLLEAMDRYIIMDDVELEADPGLAVVTVQGPKASEVIEAAVPNARRYATARLGAGGFDLWLPVAELPGALEALAGAARGVGGCVADAHGWANAHVRAGVPRYGADFDGKVYPQEAGLKERAVSFDKGCYLGQEVVCMLENRGKLSRRLVHLTAGEGASAGPGEATLTGEGSRVGEITSVATDQPPHALAFVKSAHATQGTRLRVGDSEWTVGPEASAAR